MKVPRSYTHKWAHMGKAGLGESPGSSRACLLGSSLTQLLRETWQWFPTALLQACTKEKPWATLPQSVSSRAEPQPPPPEGASRFPGISTYERIMLRFETLDLISIMGSLLPVCCVCVHLAVWRLTVEVQYHTLYLVCFSFVYLF